VRNGKPDASNGLYKGLMTTDALEVAVRVVLEQERGGES
jgi:hypothetical protein